MVIALLRMVVVVVTTIESGGGCNGDKGGVVGSGALLREVGTEEMSSFLAMKSANESFITYYGDDCELKD
jgi:hypothetical protein